MAAANALLLQEKIKLPASAVRNNVASLSDLTNVLANFALQTSSPAAEESQFYFDELLRQIPKLQYGMDVNPKFTAGIMGYEYTQQLTCFDLWSVKLVHGWLLDPTAETNGDIFEAVGNKTYNELIEVIISGREAESKQTEIRQRLDELREQGASSTEVPVSEIAKLEDQMKTLQGDSTRASCIDHFLETTGHQLTQYGLTSLHQELKDDELVVFFRNNHFATMTRHQGSLFLLVTDLGYANTPMVVWERLDVIDGDTEYFNSSFKPPGQITQSGSSLTPEQLMAQSSQHDADYHLALQLSGQPSDANINPSSQSALDTEEGQLMAAATEASLREYHGQQSAVDAEVGVGQESTAFQNQHALIQRSAPVGYTTAFGEGVEMGVPVSQSLIQPTTPAGDPAFSPPGGQPHHPDTGMGGDGGNRTTSQEEADALLAQQLMQEQQQQHQPHHTHDDWALARQLQDEEERAAATQSQQTSGQATANSTTNNATAVATPAGGGRATGRSQSTDASSQKGCSIS